ncbi:ComEC/Rec2 family competence protein [Acetobacterium tundrae]|uniref:MBL fold metallo-hydrolase n=1 Tax=Acetobacterium tundrae TaxID=132932 RepID=A0ABR6WQD2_9FIRM|nr:MBL fold metallo-hydrolase [Acetobacterium tundrae]MBC3798538.1 MBL fold metallo-hydrolase [Acetobacterium tundrae]
MGKNVVHFLQAEAGDCSVIEFDNKECIIIDCGYKSTYYQVLKPLLLELKSKGCRVILLIITHIDQDHIEGAIELIKENGEADNPNIITIDNVWFNGFFNTLFTNEIFNKRKLQVIQDSQKKKMRLVKGQLQMQNYSSGGNISAQQSMCFEEICSLNGYKLNAQFEDRIIKRNSENRHEVKNSKILLGDCVITVFSPNATLVNGLAHEFDKEMIKTFGRNYYLREDSDFAKIFELIMKLYNEPENYSSFISAPGVDITKWLGTSKLASMNPVNKASIVVEIEYKNYSFLYTGDSDSDNWKEFLRDEYDVIKISHHGTVKPNKQLIENSKATHILISTNGIRYGHPENELLARLILKNNKILHFNYEVEQKKILKKVQEKYDFNTTYCENNIILD